MREVTERDFRAEEFRNARVEDYEFRADGKLVRKDRWETAIGSIRHMVGVSGREFEIPDVVEAVRQQSAALAGWVSVGEPDPLDEDDAPLHPTQALELRLANGSILRDGAWHSEQGWLWFGAPAPGQVVAWRRQPPEPIPLRMDC